MFESGTTTLIISNEEMSDIMKIIRSLESGLLIKSFSETIKNETKEQKGGFLGMLLGFLGASLLGNLLTGKGTIRAGEGATTNFEMQKHYQNEPKFNDVYSKSNLTKIKDGAYVTNLDEYKSTGTPCTLLYVNVSNIV